MLTVLILMLYVHCTLYFIFLILLWLLQCQPVIIFEGFFIFIQEPKKRNKFKLLDSGCELTTQMIIERIISHRYEIVDHKTPIQAHFTAQKLILIIRVPSYYLLKIAAMKQKIFYFYQENILCHLISINAGMLLTTACYLHCLTLIRSHKNGLNLIVLIDIIQVNIRVPQQKEAGQRTKDSCHVGKRKQWIKAIKKKCSRLFS